MLRQENIRIALCKSPDFRHTKSKDRVTARNERLERVWKDHRPKREKRAEIENTFHDGMD